MCTYEGYLSSLLNHSKVSTLNLSVLVSPQILEHIGLQLNHINDLLVMFRSLIKHVDDRDFVTAVIAKIKNYACFGGPLCLLQMLSGQIFRILKR